MALEYASLGFSLDRMLYKIHRGLTGLSGSMPDAWSHEHRCEPGTMSQALPFELTGYSDSGLVGVVCNAKTGAVQH